jgi:predicted site-specific integrase-resolvase
MKKNLDEQFNEFNELISEISKVVIGKKKRTKLFGFKLLELYLHGEKNVKKSKIKNAKSNYCHWDPDGIQCMLLQALVKSFEACMEIHKIKKPFDISQDYISQKYLETIFDGYFEDKKDLEKEIEELEEKLEGNGMMSKGEHERVVNDLEEQIKIQSKHIEKLERQLKEREEYYKTKIACADKRAEERFKFLNQPTPACPAAGAEESEEQIEGDDI